MPISKLAPFQLILTNIHPSCQPLSIGSSSWNGAGYSEAMTPENQKLIGCYTGKMLRL
jgi:hypothetical protein